MTDADMVFYNGLNLEEGGAWFKKLLKTQINQRKMHRFIK